MKNLNDYILEILGKEIIIEPIPNDLLNGLPMFISEIYKFNKTTLFNQELMLVEYKFPNEFGIMQTEKQFDLLKKTFQKKVVLVMQEQTSFNRKRLIEKGINFIVPWKQLYLPELLLDLRESFTHTRAIKENEKLLPSAQFLLLYYLLHQNIDLPKFSFKQLAEKMNYTQMSITKAVQQLTHLGLITVKGEKEKTVHFNKNRAELWNEIEKRKLTVNPVLKTVFVDAMPKDIKLLYSNASALAEYTDINPGRQEYYAIEKTVFYGLQKQNILINANDVEGKFCLEVWKYDPAGLTIEMSNNLALVDPVSLYLTMKHISDERIEMALEKMINKYIW